MSFRSSYWSRKYNTASDVMEVAAQHYNSLLCVWRYSWPILILQDVLIESFDQPERSILIGRWNQSLRLLSNTIRYINYSNYINTFCIREVNIIPYYGGD